MASPIVEHQTHHWVRIEDNDLDLILTFDPEDLAHLGHAELFKAYSRWVSTVKDIVEDGLETA